MTYLLSRLCFILLVVSLSFAPFAPIAAAAEFTVVGSHRSDLTVLDGERVAFQLVNRYRGPNWTNPGPVKGSPAVEGDLRVYRDEIVFGGGEGALRFDLEQFAKQTGNREFGLVTRVAPNRDFVFGLPGGNAENRGTVSLVIEPSDFFKGGSLVLEGTRGEMDRPLPPPAGTEAAVERAVLSTAGGKDFVFTFTPAVFVHLDRGEIRFMLSSDETTRPAGEAYEQRMTVEAPGSLEFEAENRWVDTSDWFPVEVDNDFAKGSEIGMEDWLEKPAGKNGWLRMDGDRIVDGKGNPVKLWGTNILRANNALIDEQYMIEAPRSLAHYGGNINRLHAFAKPHVKGWAHMFKLMDAEESFEFHEEHLRLFDRIFAESKKLGIYTGWSVFYGWFPSPADIEKDRFLNWEEAQTMIRKSFPREGSFYGMTALMPDVQDLIIRWHIKLLNHVNQFTGIAYKDDPALAFVELQNEENAFLGIRNYERALANAPTYRRLYYERFAKFLKEKYGDDAKLREAWGSELKADESLVEANISPFPAWYNESQAPSRRIADQYHFVYQTQEEYYLKFKKAMREAGYGGLLIGSCWQASDWIGHLYNTYLDSRVGMIDRHNYGRDFIDRPGTGLLSAGFQQVEGVPFNFSEWGGNARVGRSLASPIMAFYGMGLQGWAGSQQFAWDHPGVLPHESTGINNSTNPFDNLAQYPTLGRSVLRGDVRQGEVAGLRRVSLPALRETGWVGFSEQFSLLSNANNKSFNAAVPQESLAVGRVLLEFVDGEVEDPVTDRTAEYIDREAGLVRSNTGELLWDVSGAGFFTVDTAGTQAVIGNIDGKVHRLGEVSIASESPYGHIYVTALDPGESIADGGRLLVTALGRAVPEGTVFDDLAFTPLKSPRAVHQVPLLLEPVQANILIERDGPVTVTPLDQNGRKVEALRPLEVIDREDGFSFRVDTGETKSVYFLVEF